MHFSAVGAAVLNDQLYVCGGYDGVASLNTVECYHSDTNKWVMVASMTKHRSAAGVVAFDGHVYAIGGHDGLSIFDSVNIAVRCILITQILNYINISTTKLDQY